MGSRQRCPICSTAVQPYSLYPRYLCSDCASEATSRDGRPLVFFNIDISGGYRAQYADTKEPYDSHECFVKGQRCWADEARLGGIVIQARRTRTATSLRKKRAITSASSVDLVTDRARGVLVGWRLARVRGYAVCVPDGLRPDL
jgi:hypothetical protein